MKTNNKYVLMAVFLLLSANLIAQNGPLKYSIKGSVEGGEGKLIYLNFKNKKVADSARITAGKFLFTGYLAAMDIIFLTMGTEMFPTVLQKGDLMIEAVAGNFNNAKIYGQQPAVDFNAYKLLADSFLNVLTDIRTAHRSAAQRKDTATMLRLGRLNDKTNADKVEAFYKRVKTHPNSMIAPLIIKSELRTLPVDEMYALYALLPTQVKESE